MEEKLKVMKKVIKKLRAAKKITPEKKSDKKMHSEENQINSRDSTITKLSKRVAKTLSMDDADKKENDGPISN